MTGVSTLKIEDFRIRQDSITKLLTDVQLMKGKQKSLDSKLLGTKHKNEAWWREVSSQFLICLVQWNQILRLKNKLALMLNDGNWANS